MRSSHLSLEGGVGLAIGLKVAGARFGLRGYSGPFTLPWLDATETGAGVRVIRSSATPSRVSIKLE